MCLYDEVDPVFRHLLKDGVVPHVFDRKPVFLTPQEKKERTLRRQMRQEEFWRTCSTVRDPIFEKRLSLVRIPNYTRKRSLVVNGTEIPLKVAEKPGLAQGGDSDSVKVLVVQITRGQTGGVKTYVSDVPVVRVFEGRSSERPTQGNPRQAGAQTEQATGNLSFQTVSRLTMGPSHPKSLRKITDMPSKPKKNITGNQMRTETDKVKIKTEPPYPVSLYRVIGPSEQSAVEAQTESCSPMRPNDQMTQGLPYPVYRVADTSPQASPVKTEPIDTGYTDDSEAKMT